MFIKNRLVSAFTSLYKQTRGKIMEGKWEEVAKQQKNHSQGWKQLLEQQ